MAGILYQYALTSTAGKAGSSPSQRLTPAAPAHLLASAPPAPGGPMSSQMGLADGMPSALMTMSSPPDNLAFLTG